MIKKLILIISILTPIFAFAGDLTKKDFIDGVTQGLAGYDREIKNGKWSEATSAAEGILGYKDLGAESPIEWDAATKDMQKLLQGLEFESFIDMLRAMAEVLRVIEIYKNNVELLKWDEASLNIEALSGSIDLADAQGYQAMLAINLKPFIDNMVFDPKYIQKLRDDLKAAQKKANKEVPTFAPGGSASSAKPADAGKEKEDIDKKKAAEAKNRGGAPKPKPAATAGAITLITDKAEFDLVVTALDKVFTDAKAADKSIMGEIASKSATKQKLINAGDQIKPVIGQVEGENTTFKRAQASAKAMKATSEQEAQLKAIEGAIKGFTADVKTIDAAAAAA